MTEYCDFEDEFNAPFIEIILFLILYMLLQIILFTRTLHHEYYSQDKKGSHKRNKTNKSIRSLFIALQLIGFYFTFIDFLRYVVDPYTYFAQHSGFMCSLLAYSPKVTSMIYYDCYLLSILIRLERSFRGSHYAIKRTTYISLAFFIIIPAFAIPIAFFVVVRNQEACIWKWIPSDIKSTDDLAICDLHSYGAANLVPALGCIWVVVANAVYGVIFTVKLNSVLTITEGASLESTFKLKSLIIKNTILTIAGSVSTLVNWFLWLSVTAYTGVGISFLYLDIWFNCLVIALMFKYNERYYKILCKMCIVCCLMRCDRTYNKNDKKEYEKQWYRTNNYLDRSRADAIHSTASTTATGASACADGIYPSPTASPQKKLGNDEPPIDLQIDLNLAEDIEDDGIITPKQENNDVTNE